MKFLNVRELRSKSAQVWEELPREGAMVVTRNGHPVALLTPVTENDFEQSLADLRRMRAARALAALQMDSVRKGTDRMTMEDIDAEIALVRAERAEQDRRNQKKPRRKVVT